MGCFAVRYIFLVEKPRVASILTTGFNLWQVTHEEEFSKNNTVFCFFLPTYLL